MTGVPALDGLQLPPGHPYRRVAAAVATRHRKTRTLSRAMGGPDGLRLATARVDTDAFGTFTGEVPRPADPVGTAVAKAHAAVAASGWPVALASEGSFVPHPTLGLFTHQVEHVVLVDTETGLTVTGRAEGFAPWAVARILAPGDLEEAVETLLRPHRRLTVRPEQPAAPSDPTAITKAVGTIDELRDAVHLAAARSTTGRARVETDLRAHQCPPRHAAILRAARDLAARLAVRCDRCGSPGFGRRDLVRGARCSRCGLPTNEPLAEVRGCARCPHEVVAEIAGAAADPGRCSYCNP